MERKQRIIKIVHLGDSVTEGQCVDPSQRWTAIVEDRLRKRFPGPQFDVQCFNRGVPGETTRLVLERFPEDVQRVRPNVLTIQFGMNDCNCWKTDCGLPRVSAEAFQANLIEMVLRARRFGTGRVILSTNTPTLRYAEMLNGEPYEHANARYSEYIRQVGIKCNAVVCDVRKSFEQFGRDELNALLQPTPDLLHLTERGHMVYTDSIWPLILDAVESCLRHAEEHDGK